MYVPRVTTCCTTTTGLQENVSTHLCDIPLVVCSEHGSRHPHSSLYYLLDCKVLPEKEGGTNATDLTSLCLYCCADTLLKPVQTLWSRNRVLLKDDSKFPDKETVSISSALEFGKSILQIQ